MKSKLKNDEICVIKLNSDDLENIIKEEIFSNYKEYGNISNRNIISSVIFKEKNGEYYLLAGFQTDSLQTQDSNRTFAEDLGELDETHIFSKQPQIIKKMK